MTLRIPADVLDVRDGLRAQPARVGLAALAIAIGSMTLTGLLAALSGLDRRSADIVRELGVNVFGILPAALPAADRAAPRLSTRHLERIGKDCAGAAATGIRIHKVPLVTEDRVVTLIAADERFLDVRQWPLLAGRFFDAGDMHDQARVAVIGADLSRSRNWSIGNVIMLRETPFEIIGIVTPSSSSPDLWDDEGIGANERLVLVPRATPAYWTAALPDSSLDAIYVRVADASRWTATLALSRRLLSQPDLAGPDLSWVTPESLLRNIRRLQRTIRLTLGSVAGLCLILGGTTLTSLMVANVRDRLREIGLRRSLGATPADIAGLFVLESCVVTGAAALAGTLGTGLLLYLSSAALPVPVHIGAAELITPVAAALLLGVGFSYWPARMAARISPAEALRND
jgi:putative ABC transport system permease protein